MAANVERIWMQRPIPTLCVSHDLDEGILLGTVILLMSPSGTVEQKLMNPLPRPRRVHMLTSAEHLRCRETIIDFLHSHAAGRAG
jgi:ABC-type nitrate/sulfonate/bicarbonate transport system ATPase subunit